MNQIISVHPHIKKIIQTLDFDLGSELTKFEQSLNQDSMLIPDILPDNPPKQDFSLVYHPQAIEPEEPISVASRLLDSPTNADKTSLLDIILTPWGVLGIIIFFGTSLFIFVNQNSPIIVDNKTENAEKNIIENNSPIPENNINNIEQLNSLNTTENNPPPLPIPLPDVNNSTENQSPNPNLKTALLNEISPSAPQTLLPPPLDTNLPPVTANSSNPPVTLPSSPSKAQKYYLVTNYENMDNFNRIKKIVSNAIIIKVNQEMKILLGTFSNENEAKKQLQQFQTQGITPEIINQ